MSNLLLTNSLTRKKEIFKPINPKKISLYACGPTVYDSPHVGNARSLVVFDVLYRILKKASQKVSINKETKSFYTLINDHEETLINKASDEL